MPAASPMKGRVLIVAGSDSGGGAGIQADIKTVTMLDGFAATAITALTAQNTLGVFGVLPIAPEFIRQQIEVVLDDIGADAVKTGMLHDAAVIETVAAVLAERAPEVPLVVDPVMVAKGGAPLIEPAAIDALKRLLMPRAAVLTPNLPEAEILVGHAIDERRRRCRTRPTRCCALGCRAVLLKGGHLAGDTVHDVLATEAGPARLEPARGSTPGIPTAPAARWPRRSPPAWRRASPSRPRSSARATMSARHRHGARASAAATARSTTPTRCAAVGRMADSADGLLGALRVRMRIPLYQIDAFADGPFTGNPAAVCPLDAWLPDEVMQAIAAENNLSETAFFVPEGDGLPAALVHPDDRGRSVRPCDAGLGVCRVPASGAGRGSVTFQTEKAGPADGRARRRASGARFSGAAAAALRDVGSAGRRARASGRRRCSRRAIISPSIDERRRDRGAQRPISRRWRRSTGSP